MLHYSGRAILSLIRPASEDEVFQNLKVLISSCLCAYFHKSRVTWGRVAMSRWTATSSFMENSSGIGLASLTRLRLRQSVTGISFPGLWTTLRSYL